MAHLKLYHFVEFNLKINPQIIHVNIFYVQLKLAL